MNGSLFDQKGENNEVLNREMYGFLYDIIHLNFYFDTHNVSVS